MRSLIKRLIATTVAACIVLTAAPTLLPGATRALATTTRSFMVASTPAGAAAGSDVSFALDADRIAGAFLQPSGNPTIDLLRYALVAWFALGVLGFVRDTLFLAFALGPRRRRAR